MNDEITVDGIVYVKKDSNQPAESYCNYPYVIVRTHSAGVFAGYLKKRKGKEGVIVNSRRIFYWDGASSLSELAMKGTSKPDKCKFPCVVTETTLTEIIEILTPTKQAKESIDGVKEWTQH